MKPMWGIDAQHLRRASTHRRRTKWVPRFWWLVLTVYVTASTAVLILQIERHLP